LNVIAVIEVSPCFWSSEMRPGPLVFVTARKCLG